MISQITIIVFLILGVIYTFVKKDRGFIKDWSPFLLLWFTYEQMRSIAGKQDSFRILLRPDDVRLKFKAQTTE